MVFSTVTAPIMLLIILFGHCEHPYLLGFTQRERRHFPTICPVPNLHAQHFPQRPFQTHLGEKKLKKKVGKSTLRQITSPRLRDQWISAGAHAAQQRLDQ